MKTATVNGVKLAFERGGEGRPLVLVHGYPLDHSIWKEMRPILEPDFDVIAHDLRGFGASAVVAGEYTIADMAADIGALLDFLRIEKTALAGHSMGGYIGLAFASAFPDRVLGLGLISTQSLADPPERKKGRYQAAEKILAQGVTQTAKEMSVKLAADERVQAFVQQLIAAQRPAGLAGALKAMAQRDDTTRFLSEFKFPVSIVHGNRDELIPLERAREMKAALPGAFSLELQSVGHMPMLEAAEATTGALGSLGERSD